MNLFNISERLVLWLVILRYFFPYQCTNYLIKDPALITQAEAIEIARAYAAQSRRGWDEHVGESVSARTLSLGCLAHSHHSII